MVTRPVSFDELLEQVSRVRDLAQRLARDECSAMRCASGVGAPAPVVEALAIESGRSVTDAIVWIESATGTIRE